MAKQSKNIWFTQIYTHKYDPTNIFCNTYYEMYQKQQHMVPSFMSLIVLRIQEYFKHYNTRRLFLKFGT
jgi:hypothetical protein